MAHEKALENQQQVFDGKNGEWYFLCGAMGQEDKYSSRAFHSVSATCYISAYHCARPPPTYLANGTKDTPPQFLPGVTNAFPEPANDD
jgi:hypothetical protein